MSVEQHLTVSIKNPLEHPELFCKDCLEVAQHVEEVEVSGWNGKWESGVNNRMHLVTTRPPSNKYPTGRGPYYVCGRHIESLAIQTRMW